MTRLHQLHDRYGQSPWLDNLTRGDLTGGRLRRLVAQGIRGVTSNPTIIAKAISGSADYDGQLVVRPQRRGRQVERLLAYANDLGLLAEESTRPAATCSATSPRPSATSGSSAPPSTFQRGRRTHQPQRLSTAA